MDTTVANTGSDTKVWGGGNKPMGASYGKLMMWFFIVSDALTFSGFLAAYGFSRFKFIEEWPIADEVFTHVPFLHGQELPMIPCGTSARPILLCPSLEHGRIYPELV